MPQKKLSITRSRAENAKLTTQWDHGNDVLYTLCKDYPLHNNEREIIAKIWLIGRTYAAAIERRKIKKRQNNDIFYINMAKSIEGSDIDLWIGSLEHIKKPDEETAEQILKVHTELTKLFRKISKMEKRSLASKYLHFHRPDLFYIYDSRATKGISRLSEITARHDRSKYKSNDHYRKFFDKCLALRKYIDEQYQLTLNPREIDNFLLGCTH